MTPTKDTVVLRQEEVVGIVSIPERRADVLGHNSLEFCRGLDCRVYTPTPDP